MARHLHCLICWLHYSATILGQKSLKIQPEYITMENELGDVCILQRVHVWFLREDRPLGFQAQLNLSMWTLRHCVGWGTWKPPCVSFWTSWIIFQFEPGKATLTNQLHFFQSCTFSHPHAPAACFAGFVGLWPLTGQFVAGWERWHCKVIQLWVQLYKIKSYKEVGFFISRSTFVAIISSELNELVRKTYKKNLAATFENQSSNPQPSPCPWCLGIYCVVDVEIVIWRCLSSFKKNGSAICQPNNLVIAVVATIMSGYQLHQQFSVVYIDV